MKMKNVNKRKVKKPPDKPTGKVKPVIQEVNETVEEEIPPEEAMSNNVVDVVLGGITYWSFGYALSFGQSEWTTPFNGWGNFFLNVGEEDMGMEYTSYFFQSSFAATATTIVSGAIAERFNFLAYVIFSTINTLVYCIPAGWLWGSHGFLYQMGAIDIAGSAGVHLNGGVAAFVCAGMVGPRIGRYDHGRAPLPLGNPTNAILGMFMLWWGWFGFNCGSTFGMSGNLWKYSARTAVTTLQASIAGGLVGMIYSWVGNHRLEVSDCVNSVLGALVGITAGCALMTSYEALFVGAVGGILAVVWMPLIDKMGVDDPVGAVAVHGICGVWGMLAIGLFVANDGLDDFTGGRSGLFRGGGFELLGVQALTCLAITVWAGGLSWLQMKLINMIVPIRMDPYEELVGADFAEHGLYRHNIGVTPAVSVLGLKNAGLDYSDVEPQGDNPRHQTVMIRLKEQQLLSKYKLEYAIGKVTDYSRKRFYFGEPEDPETAGSHYDNLEKDEKKKEAQATARNSIVPAEVDFPPDSTLAWP